MKREIKFRAKRRDADSWAFGYPYYDTGNCDFEIVETGNFAPSMSEPLGDTRNIHYPVYSDTLSQYTGLKDKNGKEIYEGDILSCSDLFFEFEGRKDIMGVINYNGNCFSLKSGDIFVDNWLNAEMIEVIGNIHENPELI